MNGHLLRLPRIACAENPNFSSLIRSKDERLYSNLGTSSGARQSSCTFVYTPVASLPAALHLDHSWAVSET